MKNRGEMARDFFLQGYNCTQSVVKAYSDIIDIPEDDLMKMVSVLGGGMGRLREVCGTVTGMFLVAGYLNGYNDPKDNISKKDTYAMVRELAEIFKNEYGSIICRDLLKNRGIDPDAGGGIPEKRTTEYYKKRPCPEMAARAAEILDKYLKQHNMASDI